MKWITLKVFDDTIAAHLLKSKLESEGISCVLLDEKSIGVQPFASIALGGIKLQVSELDWDEAVRIYQEGYEEE